ncbi:MAG: TonB-dependent receptor [Bacteroidales bacterium]|nr:TonB-dependent receptor [Bacteroidales bacterium]
MTILENQISKCAYFFKLIIIFFCISIINTRAVSFAQTGTVTINRKNAALEDIMHSFEEATNYTFLYNVNIINLNFFKTVAIEDQTPIQALNIIFSDIPISYNIINNQVILFPEENAKGSEKPFEVNGQVKDESGQPLAGVNIITSDNLFHSVSDLNGNFIINKYSGTSILFSYIGFTKTRIYIKHPASIDVVMKVSEHNLDEIVVVGYSIQKKSDLTGAVSSIKVESVNNSVFQNINQALQGRMTGVTVYSNGGAAGTPSSLRIRGLGTIGNNEPLYIVDGIPVNDISNLSVNAIEGIDVLKDAASSAIYGSRAANGVVIIRTKKGAISDKVKVSFNARNGVQSPTNIIKTLNSEQRNLIHSEAYVNSEKQISDYYFLSESSITKTDWMKEIFKNDEFFSDYDLSLSGGSSQARYNLMFEYLDNNGIIENSSYVRTNFQLNTEITLTNKLLVGENMLFSNSNKSNVPDVGVYGIISSAMKFQPDIAIYDDNGNFSGSGELGADISNPISLIKRADENKKIKRLLTNVFLKYQILENLKFNLDFGYDWTVGQLKTFVCKVPESGRPSSTNELKQRNSEETRWIYSNTLTYTKKKYDNSFFALFGLSFENNINNNSYQRASGFLSEDKSSRYFGAATSIDELTSNKEIWKLLSSFGRIDLNFKNRYLFSANIRIDGSSRFAKNNRWGVFPSFSGAWKISEEDFFKHLKSLVPNFKIRASYGKLGNQNIFDNFPTYPKISNTTDNDGYHPIFGKEENIGLGRYESNIANKDIKWEVITQFDAGADLNFLKNIDISFDWFNKITSNVLFQIPLTSLPGVSSLPWVNSGKILNSGTEFSLGLKDSFGKFEYNIHADASFIRNKVLSLGVGEAIYSSQYLTTNIIRTIENEPIAHFFGYKTDGLFNSQKEIDCYVNKNGVKLQPNAVPGDLKFIDIDNDGKIDGNDRTNIGDGFPDFSYGFNSSLLYKGIDFSFFFQGVLGVQVFNTLKHNGLFVNPMYNQYKEILNRWTPDNKDTYIPRVSVDDKNGNTRMSDFFVDNANYLRLKDLTLGYSFKKFTVSNLKFEKCRIYVTAQNLFTITKYSGCDPEVGESDIEDLEYYQVSNLGVDRGQCPQSKSFLFGLNIVF